MSKLSARLMAVSEALNSPQAHAWVPFCQAIMAALGAGLAAAVVGDGPRWLQLALAVPVVALALLGGAWVIGAAPASRRKFRAVQADAAAVIAEFHAHRPRRARPDEDL